MPQFTEPVTSYEVLGLRVDVPQDGRCLVEQVDASVPGIHTDVPVRIANSIIHNAENIERDGKRISMMCSRLGCRATCEAVPVSYDDGEFYDFSYPNHCQIRP